ncbi:MAG: Gfo/Idh/MocA family protein [Candidatus Poribacteria bacterium]
MDKVKLAIVGCGVMGNRHLNGLIQLEKTGFNKFELVSACDLVLENAESLAKRAEEFFNYPIKAVQRLEDIKELGIQAIDATVVPWEHHTVAVEAMQRGWHVMLEKPMGLTIRACNLLKETMESTNTVLCIAENFHYDPINIIGRELINSGIIGTPRLMIQNSISGGNTVIVTPWRHYKRGGGPLLDVGVHYSYVVEYLMGEVESVYAQKRLHEPIRKNVSGKMPSDVQADAEDAVYATLTFKNGAVGQFIEDHSGHGQGLWQRVIYGAKGSLNMPGDRTGRPVALTIDGKGYIKDEQVFDLIPNYHLDNLTARLFGEERIYKYELPFSDIDSGLLAIEYFDFAESILKQRKPSVNINQAMRSVGLIYAMLESAHLGRIVNMSDIMSEKVSAYQNEINEMIGLSK